MELWQKGGECTVSFVGIIGAVKFLVTTLSLRHALAAVAGKLFWAARRQDKLHLQRCGSHEIFVVYCVRAERVEGV